MAEIPDVDLPPVPPSEMPDEELAALVDAGNVEAVSRALHEHMVRLPAVLRELDRVLAAHQGNLATAIATMLTGEFHVAQANAIADRVIAEQATAGLEELSDFAAALIQQDRLRSATRVLDAALARDPKHDRALYLSSRLLARRGRVAEAFERIAKVSPKTLGPQGLAIQARYASLAGRDKAARGALKQAKKSSDDDARRDVAAVERIVRRVESAEIDLARLDLRTALILEYGAVLVELSAEGTDAGRFGADAITPGDTARLLRRMARVIQRIGPDPGELLYATEDGEVVAAGLSQILGKPYRAWRAERNAREGDWLCMGSAATHPHLPNAVVATLDKALDEGVLRTAALVLPAGWRAPLMPDVLGRLTGDDEFPWEADEEVEEILERIFDDEPTTQLVRDDQDELDAILDRLGGLLRSTEPAPRSGHVPFTDEMPVPRR